MSRLKAVKYTLVRHSAWAEASDPQFKAAVETRLLYTDGEERKVRRAGGLVFDSYVEAEDAADLANYPNKDYKGLIPQAPGTFASVKLGKQAVYVPEGVAA